MRSESQNRRGAFTLVELLVVIVIIAMLVALLVPAIGGAVRQAKNAAVLGDVNQLANALAQFQSKFGDYPPSRVLLSESGAFPTANSTPLATVSGTTDITVGQLAQRSVSYLRRFWPQFQVSTTGPVYSATTGWPDFNGNGSLDPGYYVLQGHECLVFFLGGVPLNSGGKLGMTGFSKNPRNPFLNAVQTTNRTPPFFEFAAGRLVITSPHGIPGYVDSLGNARGFYAYFSAYGTNQYDPNDVNFPEADDNGVTPVTTTYRVTMPVVDSGGAPAQGFALSPAPNPYTTNKPNGTAPVIYQKPSTFQIVSPGADGLYGPGGLYNDAPGSGAPLPYDATDTNSTDRGVRVRERDNLTSFKASRLD